MARYRVLLFAMVIVAFLSACSPAASTPVPIVNSGIEGLVLVGPACPGAVSAQNCPDKPLAATLVVQDTTGTEVASVQSGADGRFAVSLPAGSYTLIAQAPAGQMLPRPPAPIPVTLTADQYLSVTVTYDSGIR